jgi:uncharacterized membrane protein YgcG
MTRRATLWAAIALLGIAASAALAWSASQLASQRIGLSSAPLSVAAGLAPPASPRKQAVPHHGQGRSQTRPSKTPGVAPASTVSPATTVPSAPALAVTAPAPATVTTQRSPPSPAPAAKLRDDSSGSAGSSSGGGSSAGHSGGGGSSDSHQGPDD